MRRVLVVAGVALGAVVAAGVVFLAIGSDDDPAPVGTGRAGYEKRGRSAWMPST